MTITNKHNIPLSLAVFLLHDEYPEHEGENTISVSTLIKPLKQIILEHRVPSKGFSGDISKLIASRIGTAIHNGIEAAWKSEKLPIYLKQLGIADEVINTVSVNPETIYPDMLPIFTEYRTSKKVGKWTITGEFDFCGDYAIRDFKTTGTFTVTGNNNKDEDYQKQLSLYAWLNPDKIEALVGHIDFIFMDWSGLEAYKSKAYPQCRMSTKEIPLMDYATTEQFVKDKLKQIERYWDSPEEDIPACTDSELWAKPPSYKYFKNPEKLSRATRSYKTYGEAMAHLVRDGNVGIIKEVKSQVKACNYCPALSVCRQAHGYINSGVLKII